MNNSIIPALGVIFYMLSFAMGMGGTMPVYVAEIIPAVGVGVSTALQWGSAFLISYFIPKLTSFTVQEFLYIFIGFNLITVFVVGVTCIETKGLTESEIAKLYAKKARLPGA